MLLQHFVLRVLCRLAAAADARPKIIAKQEESSEEEEEDEELTPEEQGRHKLVFCGGGLGWVISPFLWFFFPQIVCFPVRNIWEEKVLFNRKMLSFENGDIRSLKGKKEMGQICCLFQFRTVLFGIYI